MGSVLGAKKERKQRKRKKEPLLNLHSQQTKTTFISASAVPWRRALSERKTSAACMPGWNKNLNAATRIFSVLTGRLSDVINTVPHVAQRSPRPLWPGAWPWEAPCRPNSTVPSPKTAGSADDFSLCDSIQRLGFSFYLSLFSFLFPRGCCAMDII